MDRAPGLDVFPYNLVNSEMLRDVSIGNVFPYNLVNGAMLRDVSIVSKYEK